MFPAKQFILITCLALAGSQAQSAEPSRSTAAAKLRKAYEQSQRASTEAEYTRVIVLCDAALNGRATAKETTYGNKLKCWAYEARGEARLGDGRLGQGLADLDAALLAEPRRARTLRLRGECLALLGRSDEALVDLDKCLQINARDAQAHFLRGELRRGAGKYTGAVQDYTAALAIDRRHFGAMMGRADALYRLGQLEPAVADYTAALKTRKQDATLYTRRGNAYADLGKYTEAADDFRRAMRIDPNHRQAFQAAAWLMCTCPDERYRQPTLAMELAKRAVELGGKEDFRALETLAASLANAGYFQEAKRVQERALRFASKTAIPHSTARLELFTAGKPYRDWLH